MVCVLTLISFLITTTSSQNIEWFRATPNHLNNIQTLIGPWSECPDWDANISLSYNLTALCVTLQVPLNWNDANNSNMIDYHISRIFSDFDTNNTRRSGAFWMLHGGPGFSGTHFFAGVHEYAKVIPFMNFVDGTFDVYIPNHRGTAYSNALECGIHYPAYLTIPIEDIQICFNRLNKTYGDDILYFSTYSASMDLGYVVDLFHTNLSIYNGTNDIIFGFSYGTYYVNQYLQLFPNQFNAVVLDSVLPSDTGRISVINNGTNEAGLQFLSKCDNNTFCSKLFTELGTTITDAIKRIYDEAELMKPANITECIGSLISNFNGSTTNQLRAFLYGWLADTDLRALIPPFIYRLYRCNGDDLERINHLFLTLSLMETMTEILDPVIQNITAHFIAEGLTINIFLSEIWDGTNASDAGPSVNDTITAEKDYYFSGGSMDGFRQGWDIWNRYTPNPAVYNKFANITMPMLILHGELDPLTNIKWGLHAANRWNMSMNGVQQGNNRYFYSIPTGLHGFLSSRIRNYTDFTIELNYDFETCAMYIIKSFIDANNGYVPDDRCIGWISDIDWNMTSNISKQLGMQYFGTTDAWGVQSVEVTSLAPTRSPLQVNKTRSPSIAPSAYPTQAPLEGNKTRSPSIAPSAYPTQAPSKGNKTRSPSIAPSAYPTQAPLEGNKTRSSSIAPMIGTTEETNAWAIVGIVFICLFAIALMVIGYMLYLIYAPKNANSKGKYQKTENEDIEVETLKTSTAED